VRVLYIYCHPLADSFHAAIRTRALDGLAGAGHQVDLCDLYAENFDPVMRADQRQRYHDTAINQMGVEDYVRRLRAAQALVVQFPVWSFGMPAMMKGFFDRLMMPGVAFDLSDPAHARELLLQIKRITGIATYGRPRSRAFVVGDPPRKMVTRYLRFTTNKWAKVDYLALYHMNIATEAQRNAFMERVHATMAKY
jgi:putative NADPH-quinone reductase